MENVSIPSVHRSGGEYYLANHLRASQSARENYHSLVWYVLKGDICLQTCKQINKRTLCFNSHYMVLRLTDNLTQKNDEV